MGGRTSSSARRVAGASLAVALGLAACASHRDGERHASGEAAPTGDDTVAVRARTTRELGVLVAAPSSSPATLPRTADGRVRITAGDTFELAFALRGASSVEPREHDGVSVYRRALDGADLVHAPLSDGVEDLVFFPDPCTVTPANQGCERGVHVFHAHSGDVASDDPIDVGFDAIDVAVAR